MNVDHVLTISPKILCKQVGLCLAENVMDVFGHSPFNLNSTPTCAECIARITHIEKKLSEMTEAEKVLIDIAENTWTNLFCVVSGSDEKIFHGPLHARRTRGKGKG